MQKLLRFILSAARKRRSFAVGAALRLLRAVLDVEKDEMHLYSDKLDMLSLNPENVSRRVYAAAEDKYLNCEDAIGFLESAIEDLEFAYEGRF